MPLPTPSLPLENGAGLVLEHPAAYMLLTYKPGRRTLADLQALITYIGHQLHRNGWHRILGDQRLMTPLSPEQSAWLAAYWHTYTQQYPGRVYAAVVHAHNVFARLAVSQLRQDMSIANITYSSFADEAAAVTWLAKH